MWKDLKMLVLLEKKYKTEIFLMVTRKSDFMKTFPKRSKVQEKEFNV